MEFLPGTGREGIFEKAEDSPFGFAQVALIE
jgi:hypothetical protein